MDTFQIIGLRGVIKTTTTAHVKVRLHTVIFIESDLILAWRLESQ